MPGAAYCGAGANGLSTTVLWPGREIFLALTPGELKVLDPALLLLSPAEQNDCTVLSVTTLMSAARNLLQVLTINKRVCSTI